MDMKERITVFGLFESFSAEEQDRIRRAALREGVAVEVLMKQALVEIAARINASVDGPSPDPEERKAA